MKLVDKKIRWLAYEETGLGLYGHEEIEFHCHCCQTKLLIPLPTIYTLPKVLEEEGWLCLRDGKQLFVVCPECLKRIPFPSGSACVDRARCALDNLAAVVERMSEDAV